MNLFTEIVSYVIFGIFIFGLYKLIKFLSAKNEDNDDDYPLYFGT